MLARYPAAPAVVRVGPGDDAAVLDLAGPVVVSTDTLVEGQDFRFDWSTGTEVGVKTAAQNLADVAAMGARPVALLVSLAAPADLPAGWARDLADGLPDECTRAGPPSSAATSARRPRSCSPGRRWASSRAAGRRCCARARAPGTSSRSPAARAPPRRGSPCCSPAAAARAGRRGRRPRRRSSRRTSRRGRPTLPGPAAAQAGASALIDTSDGLLRDAERLATASGVVLDLDPAALAPDAALLAAARALGAADEDAAAARGLQWVLSGGEDHALLGCFPPDAVLPAPFRAVGVVRAVADGGPPGVLVGGRPWAGPTGWHHFT